MAAPPSASLFGMAPFLWPCGFRVFGSMQAWAGREKARGFKALQCNQPVPKINSLFWFFFSFFLPLSVLLFFYFFFFFLLCVSSVSDRYKQKHNSKPADSGTWTCRLPLLFAWPMLLLLSLVWFALMILICFKLPPPKKSRSSLLNKLLFALQSYWQDMHASDIFDVRKLLADSQLGWCEC